MGLRYVKSGRQLMEFFLKTFGKISGIGETHCKGHVSDIPKVGFQ
jgi:hypothetical protein